MLLRGGRTSYFKLGWFEEKDEKKSGYLAEWMLWKNDDHPVYTMNKPLNMDGLPKTFL